MAVSKKAKQVEELSHHLTGIMHGIEKEGLRVDLQNHVAQSGHQRELGSTLTHPSITTDYSEALLEFITPKLSSIEDSIAYLADLHSFTLRNIDEELIWPASMPCALEGEASIPIADYGSSNVGQLKHIYRQGLAVRYGRIMQSIAGIHYNFSLPDEFWVEYQQVLGDQGDLQSFKSEQYFCLVRNFQRNSWLLHYLFGASPVLDRSFLDGREHKLEQFQQNTFGLPYATSLRMSDLGYQNSAQEQLHVSYCSLEDYIETLGLAVYQPYKDYENIGIQKDGQYIQLNANILQLENEFYSDIRPKRVTESGEKPIQALRSRGVEYIEVRILDINPFKPEGIDAQQARFMDAFLLHCLLADCPPQVTTTCVEPRTNLRNTILRGRDPDLMLVLDDRKVPLQMAADTLLEEIFDAAALLDRAHGKQRYTFAVAAQLGKLGDPDLTPSGQVMQAINGGVEFIDLIARVAARHKEYFLARDYAILDANELAETAEESLQQQLEMEQGDEIPFSEFLEKYNANR